VVLAGDLFDYPRKEEAEKNREQGPPASFLLRVVPEDSCTICTLFQGYHSN
jgi:hypothetical protein